MLELKKLCVSVQGEKPILKSLDLHVRPGEIHAIMGPNGSGKSTLSNVIAGHADYTVDAGDLNYEGQDLQALSPEERACRGVFMSFQYPVSLPGVTMVSFLQAVVNAQRKARGEALVDAIDLIGMAEEACARVGLPRSFLHRPLNQEFSGGEKKRAEMLQMLMLEPKLMILDETDSGLDIDALKMVGDVVNQMHSPERSWIIITHYHRILEHIQPDFVHVMVNGAIVKSGDASLAKQLEEKGYGWVR
jgi:Fe-S cluster assembly ATP-binding protein